MGSLDPLSFLDNSLFSNNIRPGIARPVVVREDVEARSGQDKPRLSSQVCFTPSVPKYLMLTFLY
jgi:hypothetical protein